MIRYQIVNATSHTVDKKAIEAGLLAAEKKLGDLGERHIVIEFVTPGESKKLNSKLRNKHEPTDIISLSSMETRVGEQVVTENKDGSIDFDIKQDKYIANDWPILGQLVICFECVEANAKHAGQPVSRELEWIIEHGMLHVMGFHHDDDK
jgi:probable rRNA maturation factor